MEWAIDSEWTTDWMDGWTDGQSHSNSTMYSKAAAILVAGFGIDFGLKTLDFLQVLSQFAFTQDQRWMLNLNRIAPPSSLDREFAAWCVWDGWEGTWKWWKLAIGE